MKPRNFDYGKIYFFVTVLIQIENILDPERPS